MYRLGATITQSENALKRANEDLAAQRRIYEAEQAQKAASAESQNLQATVLKWLPRVGIAVAVLVGGYLIWKKGRK